MKILGIITAVFLFFLILYCLICLLFQFLREKYIKFHIYDAILFTKFKRNNNSCHVFDINRVGYHPKVFFHRAYILYDESAVIIVPRKFKKNFKLGQTYKVKWLGSNNYILLKLIK